MERPGQGKLLPVPAQVEGDVPVPEGRSREGQERQADRIVEPARGEGPLEPLPKERAAVSALGLPGVSHMGGFQE